MKRTTLTALAAAISLAFCAGALASGTMTKAEFKNSKENIEATYKSAKEACDPLKDNAKDICKAEAKGKEKVALADLDNSYKPTAKTRSDLRNAKADADYSVAKEKCDDKAGNDKDVCMKEAKSAHVAAKADSKVQLKVTEARKDAAEDKRDAEYAVAKEKCDALKSGAKDACVNDAKSHYGKS